MEWLVFVVLMTAQGDLEKKYNTANTFEDRKSCINMITSYTPIIIEDLETSGLLDNNTLLGIGCIEPITLQEELVVY